MTSPRSGTSGDRMKPKKIPGKRGKKRRDGFMGAVNHQYLNAGGKKVPEREKYLPAYSIPRRCIGRRYRVAKDASSRSELRQSKGGRTKERSVRYNPTGFGKGIQRKNQGERRRKGRGLPRTYLDFTGLIPFQELIRKSSVEGVFLIEKRQLSPGKHTV